MRIKDFREKKKYLTLGEKHEDLVVKVKSLESLFLTQVCVFYPKRRFKADYDSVNLTQFAGECFFFQSPFEANEIFCLLNKFVLFNNQKQPLKCVRQNSYGKSSTKRPLQ